MTQQDNRAALLQQVLDSVNNWLQFAEAKNAALIAFNVIFYLWCFMKTPQKA